MERKEQPMRALVLRLSLMALFLTVGGCQDDFDDMPPCDKKAIACQNSCFKSGAGPACSTCCSQAQKACAADESYSFFWCSSKE